VLMMGLPGAGKTLLARSMPSILPALALEESLEVTRIYSVNDMLPTDSLLVRHRPFRAPHDFACGLGRRQTLAPPRRNFAGASRRAVPRRTAGV